MLKLNQNYPIKKSIATSVGVVLVAVNTCTSASPAQAGYLNDFVNQVDHALTEADPFANGTTANKAFENLDRGTIPYREEAGHRAINMAEDAGRVYWGIPDVPNSEYNPGGGYSQPQPTYPVYQPQPTYPVYQPQPTYPPQFPGYGKSQSCKNLGPAQVDCSSYQHLYQ